MNSDRSDRTDAADPAEEVGASAGTSDEEFLALIPHYYRGEVSQVTTGQDRIDRTTDWSVALITALLSVVFASESIPAYLVLIGIFALCGFLAFEVRRYRQFDLSRARVRMIEENVFANAFHPTGVERGDWREELAGDLREPTFKVSTLEAVSRRMRRIYGPLFLVLGAAWVVKVTLFTPAEEWTRAAALPGIPGVAVAAVFGAFFVCVVVVALWPTEREAKGEVHGVESGRWK